MTREEAKKRLEVWLICGECPEDKQCYDSYLHSTCEYTDYCDEVSLTDALKMAISALSENKGEWIPFSKELPPKDKKVHVSTFGIVTIGERTSEANEALRLSILEPMNNLYKNIDPKQYQITHWQPLPKGYER